MKSEIREPEIAGPFEVPLEVDGEVSQFHFCAFKFNLNDIHYCVWKGDIFHAKNPLVRIHSACSLAQIFHSQICDCEGQLQLALRKIKKEDLGLIIYVLNHEGRGVGYWDHMQAYQVHETQGADTYEAYRILGFPIDLRDYSQANYLLKRKFWLSKIRLLTNNPDKIKAVKKAGIEVTRVACEIPVTQWNRRQIKAKKEKGGHLLNF